MRAGWALILLIPMLSGCATFWTGNIEPVPAPDFQVVDSDGITHNLTDYEGPLLLDFMGTWCPPCQRAVPIMHDLQEAYPDLEILSVSGTASDTDAKLNDFKAQHGSTWPHVADPEGVIVDSYREAGSSASSMMWPSYAIVIDGELVFYNRGETLAATFTTALDSRLGRTAPAVTSEVAPLALLAFGLGAAAWFSPWLRPIIMESPRRRDRTTILWPIVFFVGIGAMAGWASRPLSGRVATVSPFVAAAAIAAVLWWRFKGAKTPQGGKLRSTTWRHGLSLHGNFLWYGLPAWLAVLHAAMMRTAPVETLLMVSAFGFGVAASEIALWGKAEARIQGWGERAGWLGAIALLIGAAWNGWLYILR